MYKSRSSGPSIPARNRGASTAQVTASAESYEPVIDCREAPSGAMGVDEQGELIAFTTITAPIAAKRC